MPGCQESRQPGTIILLERYVTKYEMRNKFSPIPQADKRQQHTI
jgi:hypothetical protein